ncbi:hypothetical protein [Ectobacillus polymachus]|uniref:hypothetical protein n=1 Tax=Ectobacillus polymachus TaxID=1508806 RepID=UPI003A8C7FF2
MDKQTQTTSTSPIKTIFDNIFKQKDVSLVYGDPIVLENKRILPVAKVRNFGGGGGGGRLSKEETSPIIQGEGGGGSGLVSVTPLGVYEITEDETTFKPVVDIKFILVLLSMLTFGLVWIFKKLR